MKLLKASGSSPFSINQSDVRIGVGVLILGLMAISNSQGWTKIDATTFQTVAGLFGVSILGQIAKMLSIAHVAVGTNSPLDNELNQLEGDFSQPSETSATQQTPMVTTVAPVVTPQSTSFTATSTMPLKMTLGRSEHPAISAIKGL